MSIRTQRRPCRRHPHPSCRAAEGKTQRSKRQAGRFAGHKPQAHLTSTRRASAAKNSTVTDWQIQNRHPDTRKPRRNAIAPLSPLRDRSRSAGSEEMSNPLRIANARSAEGSVPMACSCSGLSPSFLLIGSGPCHWVVSLLPPVLLVLWPITSIAPRLLGLRGARVQGRWFFRPNDMAWTGPCPALVGDPPFSGLGVDAVFRWGGGGSWRILVSPFQLWSPWAGVPVSLGHSGGEARCFSWIRVSQASLTICLITGPSADDDEATAWSLIGRIASATLLPSHLLLQRRHRHSSLPGPRRFLWIAGEMDISSQSAR